MMKRVMMVALALVACGKDAPQKSDKEVGSANSPAPAGSGSATAGSAAAEPVEAATVSGPTKSATGALELSGKITGKFEWVKKDQRAPMTCVWDPEKEIGTLKIDVSDGAGKVVTLGLDVPPTEVGPGRLEVISKDLLPTPLKTYSGFSMKEGDDADHFKVVFDETVAVTDPDAQMNAKSDKKKKAEPPPDPHVAVKGTLEVTCPKKK
jgi:hypothetical protein